MAFIMSPKVEINDKGTFILRGCLKSTIVGSQSP
jgi:hypothetical protein